METKRIALTDSELIERIYLSVGSIEKRMTYRDADVLVSNTEAARQLNCSPNTICRMIKEGRLHRVTRGDSSGIPLSEVNRLKTP